MVTSVKSGGGTRLSVTFFFWMFLYGLEKHSIIKNAKVQRRNPGRTVYRRVNIRPSPLGSNPVSAPHWLEHNLPCVSVAVAQLGSAPHLLRWEAPPAFPPPLERQFCLHFAGMSPLPPCTTRQVVPFPKGGLLCAKEPSFSPHGT